jgi:hypothetical protein
MFKKISVSKLQKINIIIIFISIGLKLFDNLFSFYWISHLGLQIEANPLGEEFMNNTLLFTIFQIGSLVVLFVINLTRDKAILMVIFSAIIIFDVFCVYVAINNISAISQYHDLGLI